MYSELTIVSLKRLKKTLMNSAGTNAAVPSSCAWSAWYREIDDVIAALISDVGAKHVSKRACRGTGVGHVRLRQLRRHALTRCALHRRERCRKQYSRLVKMHFLHGVSSGNWRRTGENNVVSEETYCSIQHARTHCVQRSVVVDLFSDYNKTLSCGL